MSTVNHLICFELKLSRLKIFTHIFLCFLILFTSFFSFESLYVVLISILLFLGVYGKNKVRPIFFSQIEYRELNVIYSNGKTHQLFISKVINYYFCFVLYTQEKKPIIVWRDQVDLKNLKKLILFSKLI